MNDQNVGTVLVVDGNRAAGLVADRAIVTKVVADQQDPRSVSVSFLSYFFLRNYKPN
jgi:hypothetical protein